ncbi:hypothetical protein MG293_020087 [Ovis ammon polii]|uniref:Uncharacterized protein n=1 Tax=Ovis ammon polii TaxID=230172 RepID=A0AAD4Y1P4_OVIAM|nr:hypothetical protein MG293_020087 [Ovis ammon polii]
MSGPRGEFKRGTVFSPQVLATVSPGSQRFPGKRFLVRRWTRAQCLHRESAQQGKVRLLSTKMDCNLPPLVREEQHVSTRSLTPLLMLENPEDLLLGSTFKRWPELPAGFLGECAHDMGPTKAENRAYIIAAILPGTAGALRVRGVSRALVLGPGTTEGDANRPESGSKKVLLLRPNEEGPAGPSMVPEGPLSPGLISVGQGPAFHMGEVEKTRESELSGRRPGTARGVHPRFSLCEETGPFDSGTRPLYVALASLGRANPPMAADFLCIWR